MRIALIRNHDTCTNTRQHPVVQSRAGVLPHLGLGYIHTALDQAGHDVRTIDAQAEGLTESQLTERLRVFGPELAGVTTTTPGFPGAKIACDVAKSVGATVVLGGPHTEAIAQENFVHPSIDYVGVGEGASIMRDLADGLSTGKPVDRIPGLVGRSFSSPPAAMVPLQELGWPQRLQPPIEAYKSLLAKNPFTTMISSRGCPFKCSFCFKQAIDKKSYFRPAKEVVDEMQYLVETFGVREIMFYDDVFTMKRKRVYEVCREIGSRGLTVRWEAPTRIDIVDSEMLQAMADAGCVRLRYGLESGSPRILRHMRKPDDLAKTRRIIRETRAAGIQTFGYFIVGYLDETRAEYEETLDLAIGSGLDYAAFYAATPLPGTALFREAASRGLVSDSYWEDYIAGRVSGRVPYLVDQAEERSREAYRRFYLRARRLPAVFKSMARRGMFMKVSGGILSLVRSNSNVQRDM